MKFIDLFAGIGGFRLALERVGGFECVWTCEMDRWCRWVYRKNFGQVPIADDVTRVDTKIIPDFDLLCAGFPCQSFSMAGKRGGFNDTRGTLFFEICRIARDKRPSYLLLENVKGLLSHQDGQTFAAILLSLDELGYDAEWQVLNSKHFGVPQSRERVFIVGHLRREGKREVFPIEETDEVYYGKDEAGLGAGGQDGDIADKRRWGMGNREPKGLGEEGKVRSGGFCGEVVGRGYKGQAATLMGSYGSLSGQGTRILEETDGQSKQEGAQQDNVEGKVGKLDRGASSQAKGPAPEEAPDGGPWLPGFREQGQESGGVYRRVLLARLPDSLQGAKKQPGLLGKETIREQEEGQEGKRGAEKPGLDGGEGVGARISELSSYQGDKVTQPDETHPCLPAQGGNKLKGIGIQQDDLKIRRLTPTECERLQGFPDNFTKGISDTQRYKMLGNAVTVNVVEVIGRKLIYIGDVPWATRKKGSRAVSVAA